MRILKAGVVLAGIAAVAGGAFANGQNRVDDAAIYGFRVFAIETWSTFSDRQRPEIWFSPIVGVAEGFEATLAIGRVGDETQYAAQVKHLIREFTEDETGYAVTLGVAGSDSGSSEVYVSAVASWHAREDVVMHFNVGSDLDFRDTSSRGFAAGIRADWALSESLEAIGQVSARTGERAIAQFGPRWVWNEGRSTLDVTLERDLGRRGQNSVSIGFATEF